MNNTGKSESEQLNGLEVAALQPLDLGARVRKFGAEG